MKKVIILTSLIFFGIYNLYSQIPTDSLIGFWPFNGNADDLSVNNNNGIVNGATLVSDRFGNNNRAYYFDGNDYISIPHSTTLNMQDSLSFSVWVKPETLSGTRMVFGKSNYATKTNYLLRIKPSGYIQWEYNGYTDTDSIPLQINTWSHIVVTASGPGQVKRVYINNQLVKETLTSSGPFGIITNPFTIGYASYGNEYFIGAIDDIRMYNKVLSVSEIDALFNESCNNSTSSITETACDSYTAPDGQVYTTSGFKTAVIPNATGCDSTITIDLTVNHSSTSSITETACDSYTAPDGQVYATSGFKTAVIPNATGCDSTITIDLTVNHSSSSSITETACDSYTAPDGQVYTTSGFKTAVIPNATGCDSTITIDLTVNHSSSSSITETACDSYTAPDGQVYTTSGFKTAVIPNATGCDSTITIDLKINTVDVSVTQNGIILKANASADFYQWLDCDNGYSTITGETGQSFTANTNGNYAVEVTQNSCVDTSTCYSVTTVGILENTFGNDIIVYPNPTKASVKIDLGETISQFVVSLNDINGKLISQSTYQNTKVFELNLNVKPGIYILTINTENKKVTIRLVKN